MMESMNGDVAAVRRPGALGDRLLEGVLLDGSSDDNEQACTDPKECPQPTSLVRNAPFEADAQACTDPKECPQPTSAADSAPQ
jgi:hypothetical protein